MIRGSFCSLWVNTFRKVMYLTLPQFDVLYDAPDFLSSYVNYRYMNDLVNTRNTQKDEAVSSPLATDLINYKIIV